MIGVSLSSESVEKDDSGIRDNRIHVNKLAGLPVNYALNEELSHQIFNELKDDKNRLQCTMTLLQYRLMEVHVGDFTMIFNISHVNCHNVRTGAIWSCKCPSFDKALELSPAYRKIVNYALDTTVVPSVEKKEEIKRYILDILHEMSKTKE